VKNIHKFITHIVHNLFPLNEYSEGEIKRLMDKFTEEADDLNIDITPEQLKIYIERFDQIKNSPKITEKDLRKYSLNQLIRLVSTFKGAEAPEQADITPDVVYNNDDNSIVIYNGSNQDNCVRYGNGEKWCITKTSFGTYRYSEVRQYPTFYLAKNNNLTSSNPLSFVAIQVRDTSDLDKKYVFTNRNNTPHESDPMSFENLLNSVPWLKEIPNLKNILKYIPLSNKEKLLNNFKHKPTSIRDWLKFPYSVKEQYLVVRKGDYLFSDISNDEFISKFLPKIPQLATFISTNFELININLLLKYLDKFNNQDRRSIIANMRENVDLNLLPSDAIPFDVKKLLTNLDKWDKKLNEKLYVTKNGEAIVKLFLSSPPKISVYTEEDDYPNVKLNQRTVKYLLDYPDLSKIPFNVLLDLNSDGLLGKDFIETVINNAQNTPDSSIIVKEIDGKKILLDSNSFTAYKIEGDKIVKIKFDSEEVTDILSTEVDNVSFQQNALDLLKKHILKKEDLPGAIDKNSFFSLIRSIPYNQRVIDGKPILVTPPNSPLDLIFIPSVTGSVMDKKDLTNWGSRFSGYKGNTWPTYFNDTLENDLDLIYSTYFSYLRAMNMSYSNAEFNSLLGNYRRNKSVLKANPPLSSDVPYRIVITPEDEYLLINVNNPRESKIVSPTSGKLIKANISPNRAASLLRNETSQPEPTPLPTDPTPQQPQGVRRRGRPSQTNTPTQPPVAPQTQPNQRSILDVLTNVGLAVPWSALPQNIKNKFNDFTIRGDEGDRGASRRNNFLGARGRVINVISSNVSNSVIYLIRLTSGTSIASMVVQPGNMHLLLTNGRQPYNIQSPSNLIATLQNANINEIHKGLAINLFLSENSNLLEETKEILRKHINQSK